MAEKIPNHTCKYSKCGKRYYACDGCEKIGSWRIVACCPEHYQAYILEIEEKEKIIETVKVEEFETIIEDTEITENIQTEIVSQNSCSKKKNKD